MNTVEVQVKIVYGESKVYPVCTQAKLFADIAGSKTLTPATLKSIKALGFAINVVAMMGANVAASGLTI